MVSCPTRVSIKIGYTVHFRMTAMFKIRAQLSWKTWNWIEENAKCLCYFGFSHSDSKDDKSSIFFIIRSFFTLFLNIPWLKVSYMFHNFYLNAAAGIFPVFSGSNVSNALINNRSSSFSFQSEITSLSSIILRNWSTPIFPLPSGSSDYEKNLGIRIGMIDSLMWKKCMTTRLVYSLMTWSMYFFPT